MTPTPDDAAEMPDLPPRGSMSWDGETLVVDPADPRFAEVRRKRLSASTSNSMQDCAARWFAEKLTPSEQDPFAPMHVGTAAHAVMEDLFDRPHDQRTPEDAYGLLVTVRDRHPDVCAPADDDPVTLARWRDKVTLVMAGLWEIEDPATVMPGQREQHLDLVSVNGVPLTGFIDRVDPVVTEDGTVGQKIVDYKGLATDTPIPTPDGWTTMGDLSVGDQVYGTSGQPVTVTVKSGVHHRPCYRITFSDGTSVVCDNVHLWTVTDPRGRTETIDADELHGRIRRRRLVRLPVVTRTDGTSTQTYVTSVEPVESVPTQCIQVDAADSLYLCGEGMVPTHNTGKWSSQSKLKMYGDDYAEQMRLYALALQQLTGQLPVEAELYYTAVGKSRKVPLGPRLLDQSARRFADSWARHEEYAGTGRWPTRPSGLCNFCPLATVCPAAARQAREKDRPVDPKTDTYLYGEAMFDPLPQESDEPCGQTPEPADDLPPEPVEPPDLGPPPAEPPHHDHEPARHTTGHPETTEENDDMAAQNGPWAVPEDKPWEETSQGDVQPAAYAATAAFGTASMAVDQLCAAGQDITANNVRGLALTLSSAVLEVQTDLAGKASFQRSLNTRLRGALHTALAVAPVPFGADDETWEAWYAQVKRTIRSIAVVAHELWNSGVVDRPWTSLVEATTERQPVPTNQN